jgi:hypothetical protein
LVGVEKIGLPSGFAVTQIWSKMGLDERGKEKDNFKIKITELVLYMGKGKKS